MDRDVDLLILGGGCAGLSLGMRLAALLEGCPRTLILERRTHYTHDRTWCFWKDEAVASHPLVQHSWGQMNLRRDGKILRVSCGQTPYQMLPSHSFYNAAQQTIQASTQLGLQLGISITGIPQKIDGMWHLQTTSGTVRASRVIDTRPPFAPCAGGATLWQSFSGIEVETSVDCFDPTQVELMDFSEDNPSYVAFTYVLPTDPRRALIEMTRFSVHPYGPEVLEEKLLSEVSRYTNRSHYSVIHREHGILPMGLRKAPPVRDPSYLHAGLYAGAARPSTGYAFQRIQRWAEACAVQLGKGDAPCGHAPDSLLRRAMDHLFLHVIRTNTAAAPALFMALFRSVEPARMIRFLSDRATLSDCVAIIQALPAGMFLREIPQALRSRFSPNHTEVSA
jgi:lycopene beta-cyclase